ncbi:MAG: aminotransferase class III-fold pyridoxal phosphate-dependent enzyme [Gammaproteobacteria bacterium]|nr:aminotransferase class III-fold pyridoxal phosphate-dependent enzyme [Gammaproteobacteria bacterium]NNL51245.1 aminotransferase class III-fold pyridoxal phosphate-dependent enzyme [Woeseiaceae bacterium]
MVSRVANLRNGQSVLSRLKEMRDYGGAAVTRGLTDETVLDFLEERSDLATAIDRGYKAFLELKESHPDFLALEESEQITQSQDCLTNFYRIDGVNPYVAIGAAGPWIVTLKGAVIYDCGGYGMLGFGHAPSAVLEAMNQPHVMANVMTPSMSQLAFTDRLQQEIGHTRPEGFPFATFICINSGSEAMTVASRIADINALKLTEPGGRYEGRKICGLTLKGSFHGRTDRPARLSDSTHAKYEEHLATFRESDYLLTVAPNDIESLEAVFASAEADDFFIEAFFMEPVMGEGNPGLAIEPAFYQRARELTREHGAMFVVDSIQAGLRAHGVLSIVDYPGFQDLDAPDMESYSKALNAGQYPLSALALSDSCASAYRRGLYGNTMTSNPRAMDIGVAVLDSLSDELRENIRTRGKELVAKFGALSDDTDGAIASVQGTGLLLSCELDERYTVYGSNSTEDYLRRMGLSVIHGGKHSLRYTPVFNIGEKEVDLIVKLTRQALLEGPSD